MQASDLVRAFQQLSDPAFLRVILKSVAITLGALALLVWGVVTGVDTLLPDTVSLPFRGEVSTASPAVFWAVLVLMIWLSVFLMVPVAAMVVGLFLDDVVSAVEARHYPHLPPVAGVPFAEALVDGLRFLAVIVLANLLALILYLLATVFAPLIFLALNGFLLGREYFQMVAARRLGRVGADVLRRRHWGAIWLSGAVMALPLSIPVINLFVPVIAVAAFTHHYHRVA